MFNYLKKSIQRKIARRVTKHYPPKIDQLNLEKDGLVEFANWTNPLAAIVEINQSMVDFFRKFIKEGDLVIDIGANIGDTTVPMGLAAGKDGLTIGFDPNPYLFRILEQNAALNQEKTNVVVFPYAISQQDETYYFASSEASFANGGISPTQDSRHGKFVHPDKVKGVRLSEFLQKEYKDRLNKFSFIKIDTEGYDKEILKSISDLITSYKPVIVAESFGKSNDEAKMELFEIIHQHGYDVFYFADFQVDAEVQPVQRKEEMTQWKHTVNIYAIPQKS